MIGSLRIIIHLALKSPQKDKEPKQCVPTNIHKDSKIFPFVFPHAFALFSPIFSWQTNIHVDEETERRDKGQGR